ncbi:hypothetical protein BDZ88DRAFT_30350 [Geranomyces variabilis]|nr:hypothetical protein BDZ88DRAFT_30350 [Geranomyces variabilis]
MESLISLAICRFLCNWKQVSVSLEKTSWTGSEGTRCPGSRTKYWKITDQKTLHALSLVCRGFNRCTTPRLYLAPKFADTFAWAQFSIQIRPHVGSSAGLASFVQVVDLSCDKPLVASDERRQPNATILPADPNVNAGANQQVAQTDFTSSSGPQSRVLPVFLSPTVVTLRRVPMEAAQHTARKASASAATSLISFPHSPFGASGSSSAAHSVNAAPGFQRTCCK